MPFIGSAPNQTFQRTDGTRTGSEVWQEAKTANVKIRADAMDTHDQDQADALSALWLRNGGNQPTADLPMNSQKFTGVGLATARTHFAAMSQVQDSTSQYAGTSSGTDTITATLSPAITAYAAGQRFHFRAGGTNTGAATLNLNSVGAADIKKGAAGTTALAAGDITTGGLYFVAYNGTTGDFELLNPSNPAIVNSAPIIVLTDTDTGASCSINANNASGTLVLHADVNDSASNSVINFAVDGSAKAYMSATQFYPASNDGIALGTTASSFSDLFLASGGVINFNNGNATITHSAGVLNVAVTDLQHAGSSVFSAGNVASQAQMETGTSTAVPVTPGRQHFHPAHPKAGGNFFGTGTPAFRSTEFGMGTITDNGTGDYALALDTAFSDTNYWITAWGRAATASSEVVVSAHPSGAKTSSSIEVECRRGNDNAQDSTEVGVMFWGDYA